MKTSVIRQRVADFLRRYPPFDSLSEDDLLVLACSGKVRFHECEEYIFREGDNFGSSLWMIEQGRVEILVTVEGVERIRDIVGGGDLLGVERLIGGAVHSWSARTASDVVLYGISTDAFEPLMARYPAIRRYLAARSTGSGNLGFQRKSWLDAEPPSMVFLKARTRALIGDVSKQGNAAVASSLTSNLALVERGDGGEAYPVVSAMHRQTSLGSLDLSSKRVATIGPGFTVRTGVRCMLESRSDTLLVTEDGETNSAPLALLSADDLACFSGFHPTRIVESIRHSQSPDEIREWLGVSRRMLQEALAQPADVDTCCQLDREVVAAVTEASIRQADAELRAAGIEAPPVPYCWLLFGSTARGDLLGDETPTIAVVYDDSVSQVQPDDRIYFAAVAGATIDRLHAFGFREFAFDWPQGSQPGMPLSEWERLYAETIRNPLGHDLYRRRSFFDTRALFGDVAILERLQGFIGGDLCRHNAAIPLLANDTLTQVPPLTFFRGMVLDLDGEASQSFDVAEAVIFPVANAARVFALELGQLANPGTLERLQKAELELPDASPVIRRAADAFRVGIFYRTLSGSNRIDPRTLGKFDQILLKTAFSAVHNFLEFTVATFAKA